MKALNRLFLFALMILTVFALSACGDDDDSGDDGDTSSTSSGTSSSSSSSSSGGSSSGGDGTTVCSAPSLPEVICAAGQYCADQNFQDCQNGCLSNDNCAGDQTCIKAAGEDVGSCQNNTTTPTGPTVEEFTTKCLACGLDTVTADQCAQIYNAVSEACRTCIVASNCNDETACEADCNF